MNVNRLVITLVITVATAAALFQPAAAIQYGQPDNGAHPYVGGLVYEFNGSQIIGCSGTLIGPTTFLTASHCAPDDEFVLVGVTFDDAFVPGDSTVIPLSNDAFIVNPNYDGTAYTDVAVVLLPYDPGVGYASLPEIGVLDTMAPSEESGDQARALTAVGYGTTGLNRGTGSGKPHFVYPEIRMQATNQVIGTGKGWLQETLVKTTAAPGTGGGTCYGDSGGPFFISDTNVIVAITISGTNRNCGGADINYRIDTVAAQEFITQYL